MVTGRRTGRLAALLLLVAMLVTAVPGIVLAAESMDMQQMYFSIWPEYDTPDVLVIYSGTFVNNTGKPFDGEIVYRMPKDAKVNMVCETENGMVCQPYNDQTVEGDFRLVRWRPSHPIQPGAKFPVMFEYNFNPVQSGGPRNFQVVLKPDFPVGSLQVDVKAPLRSTDVKLTPEPQQTQTDQDGFTNYFYTFSNVKAGDQLAFQVSYNRPDAQPSVAKATGGGGSSGGEGQAGKSSFNSTVIILLLAFLAVLGVFLVLALRGGNAGSGTRGAAGRGEKPDSRKGASGKHSAKSGSGAGAGGQGQRSTSRPAGHGGSAPGGGLQEEKKKIRRMLLDGKISEETYRQLMAELEEEKG